MVYDIHKYTDEELEVLWQKHKAEEPARAAAERKEKRELRRQNKLGLPYTSDENRDARIMREFLDSMGGKTRELCVTEEEKKKFFIDQMRMPERLWEEEMKFEQQQNLARMEQGDGMLLK
ncbi:MAG: hypothetical protein LBL21_04010 [Rickettsiales bacterium]|jgi:hypothetical protein|nr:hypothetical protein [Rickettsiales bacterium]